MHHDLIKILYSLQYINIFLEHYVGIVNISDAENYIL